MSVRRSAAVALAAAALVSGCTKSVTQESPPAEIVIAAFNSAVVPNGPPAIPTPNDLAMAAAPTLPASAQKAFLQAFIAAGGFPSDQAVGITVPLKRLVWNEATSAYALATPPLIDPASLTTTGAAPTVVVLRVDVTPPQAVVVQVDVENCTTGQIALKKAASATGSRAWAPGRYAFAIRGGAAGVRTRDGFSVNPDQALTLVLPNLDLTNGENQPPGGLPPATASSLDTVRKALWNPTDWAGLGNVAWVPNFSATGVNAAFAAVSPLIPPAEVASIATFEVAGSTAAGALPTPVLPVDSGSGIAPLPLDLLRTASSGTKIAFNPSFGPAAEGLATLDGFSTTALIFAPVTFPLDASSVNGSTVHLFRSRGGTLTLLKELKYELGKAQLGDPAARPGEAAYVAEPDPITTSIGKPVLPGVTCAASGGCSVIVGLQAGVGAPTPAGTFYLPPLEEATDYAVVITTSVRDMVGRPFQKSTIAKLLIDPGFDPIATSSVNGKSLVSGIPDDSATALQKMREQLVPVLAAFRAATGKTDADVALAYTFRTQGGIASTALGLVQVPYAPTAPPGIAADPAAVTTLSPTETALTYGVDPTVVTTRGTVKEFAEVKVQTVSWLLASQNKGAFDPAHPAVEAHTALVVVPDPALVTGSCPAGFGYTASRCAPLVLFAHGLGDSKAQVLPIAGALAAQGFVVAAIDMPMHGERSYCSGSGPNAQLAANAMCCPADLCGTAHTCAFKANLSTPVDVDANGPIQIGVCESAPGVRGRMLDRRWDCPNPFNADGSLNRACLSLKGTAVASANRFISLNFFRVRDALRQYTIDASALVKALAPIGKSTDPFASYLEGQHGLAIDYAKVYWVGHSGGTFFAAPTLAANPRISRAVVQTGGATAIDVFANPESHYHADLVKLLAGAGVAEGTADYLKFLQIGKWILDPADPANFARYWAGATSTPLPSPLAVPPFDTTPLAALWPAQPPRDVLTQISLCDGTVPNKQNTLFSALVGRRDDGTYLAGYSVPAPAASTTGRVQWFSQSGAAVCPTDAVGHSNTYDFKSPTLAVKAQDFTGSFLASPANVVTPVLP